MNTEIVMMLKAVSLPPPGGFLFASGIASGAFLSAQNLKFRDYLGTENEKVKKIGVKTNLSISFNPLFLLLVGVQGLEPWTN